MGFSRIFFTLWLSVSTTTLAIERPTSQGFSRSAYRETASTGRVPVIRFSYSIGGTGLDRPSALAYAPDGSLYVAGIFGRSIDFGLPFGQRNQQQSRGRADIFLMKIRSDGSLAWTRTLGGKNDETAAALAVAPSGEVYLLGSYLGKVDFSTGFPPTRKVAQKLRAIFVKNSIPSKDNKPSRDLFLLKASPNGDLLTVSSIGGTGEERDTGLAIARDGSLYISGSSDTAFDPGKPFAKIDFKQTPAHFAFVTKLSQHGSYDWTKTFGEQATTFDPALAAMADGGVLCAGLFYAADFGRDFGARMLVAAAGQTDAFLIDISREGALRSFHRLGSKHNEFNTAVALAPNGERYLSGIFQGGVDFGEDFRVKDYKESPPYGLFLTHFARDGRYLRTKTLPGQFYYSAPILAVDHNHQVFIAGRFRGDVDFGKDFGVVDRHRSEGPEDAFITALSGDLGYRYTIAFGGKGIDGVTAIAPNPNGGFAIAGLQTAAMRKDSDLSAKFAFPSSGNEDIFVAVVDDKP